MARSLVLTTDGCSDVEREYAFHRFREDGQVVDVVSSDGGAITGIQDDIHETTPIADCQVQDYDAVVVPTGWTGERLLDTDEVLDWLDSYLTDTDMGVLGLSGTSVELLTELNSVDLNERTIAGPSDVQRMFEDAGATFQDELVTVDGRIVTARDTTALPFFIVAVRSNMTIPQALAHQSNERASWGG